MNLSDLSLKPSALRFRRFTWGSHSRQLLLQSFKPGLHDHVFHANGRLLLDVFVGAMELGLFIKSVPLGLLGPLEFFFLLARLFKSFKLFSARLLVFGGFSLGRRGFALGSLRLGLCLLLLAELSSLELGVFHADTAHLNLIRE